MEGRIFSSDDGLIFRDRQGHPGSKDQGKVLRVPSRELLPGLPRGGA